MTIHLTTFQIKDGLGPRKWCFMTCKVLPHCHKMSHPHPFSHVIVIWEPVHIYNQLPSTLQSCDCHLHSSLLASTEDQWKSWQGSLQAATTF